MCFLTRPRKRGVCCRKRPKRGLSLSGGQTQKSPQITGLFRGHIEEAGGRAGSGREVPDP